MRLALLIFTCATVLAGADTDWPAYGGNAQGNRYSTLKQIDRTNVSKLEVAWTLDTKDGEGSSQTQPIVINGILYGLTPKHKAIAVDGATGKLLWTFDSGVESRGPNRGLTYWSDGRDARIFAAAKSFIYALDPKTGKPIPSFGESGRIDLRQGLGRDPEKANIVLTTPGIIYKDLLIVGGRTPEGLPSPPGDIRAYDVRTGKARWQFHTIPHPGEFGYDTWPKDAWTYSGSANNWAGMALDEVRGIVYVPTGSAASDFYGADRVGDNLFANTLLALKADTGERVWHYQGIKHDIWDRDFPSQPVLARLRINGRQRDAVIQLSKQAWVYMFDRATGEPLFPVTSQAYPASDIPGEKASVEQSKPTKPEPFARQRLTEDMLTQRTPEAHQWAVDKFREFLSEGQFIPFRTGQQTVVFPGFDGGPEWGGAALDPETGVLYVNANDLAWTGGLAATEAGSYRFTGYRKFLDPDGYPAVQPPWGTLNAINLNNGDYAWKIPLGEYPDLVAKGLKDTGTENYGGPIVTAGGLVFIAATNFDKKIRAFDKQNGKLLWEATLPLAGNATPVTYTVGGKQYIVIYATGGKGRLGEPSGGIYVAFALPETKRGK